MTPAEELTAAADKLDGLIAGASDGPWATDGSEVWIDTPEPRHAFFLRGWTADAAYIAAMNPLVGKALAAWLREMATGNFIGREGRALDIARLINGGAS